MTEYEELGDAYSLDEDLLNKHIQDIDYKDQVEQVLMTLASTLEGRLQEFEKYLENFEKQIATLVIGFGEQAVFMDALIAQMAFSSEESKKAFHDTINKSRKQMLEIMKEGANDLLGSSDPGISSAIESLANEQLSNFTD